MPGSTLDTRPLYKLPTTPRERSRSMNISATWSSSRIATRVSWALEEMIISLVMPDAPLRARRSPPRRVPLYRQRGGTHDVRREQAGQEEDEEQQREAHKVCRAGLQPRRWSQFVKRRIRTLRIRPNPASVAIMEEPP